MIIPAAFQPKHRKPRRILDLFCCAGGSAMGFHRERFIPYGIDTVYKVHYPFAFYHGHALETLAWMLEDPILNEIWVQGRGRGEKDQWLSLNDFVAVNASPPCQEACTLSVGTNGLSYEQLIPRTRELLIATGLPYIIENVPNAPLRKDLELCGEMFGLRVIRHRIFEANFPITQPEHVPHRGRVKAVRHGVKYEGYYFGVHGHGGGKGSKAQWMEAMGIDWNMTVKEVAEAIPPAYTEYIGRYLNFHLDQKEAA